MDVGRRRLLRTVAMTGIIPAAVRAEGIARKPHIVYVPTLGQAREHRQIPGGRERFAQYFAGQFAESGFKEGRDFSWEYLDLELGDPNAAAIEARAKDVIRRQPDAILAGEDSVLVLKPLTTTIPIVFYQFGGDPTLFGLVESYSRPGANITGTTLEAPGIDAKGWELLKELSPRAKRIGVLWGDDEMKEVWTPMAQERQRAAASRIGLEYVPIVIARGGTFAAIERAIRAARIDLIEAGVIEEPWVPELIRFVERARIPALWPNSELVRRGGLASASPAMGQAMWDAIAMVVLILRGANAATLPVRVPTRFVTAINLRTAKAMGLDVPPSVLLRANVVVEK